jgi:hypothetical protein
MSRGVIYIASGQEYVNEAINSAESVKRHNNLNITIFTNHRIKNSVFDRVINITEDINTKADSILEIDILHMTRTYIWILTQ